MEPGKMAAKIALSIQTGIPLPTREALVNLIPWDEIKVGSSFPVTRDFGDFPVQRLRTAIDYRQKMTGERFSVRKTAEGYRCWRTA
jgi:hypothetical protein